jgi:N-acetylglutamate synthase-like GNAT family acetyltransferase
MTKFTPVKMPKYRGKNRFIKALLRLGKDHMVYYGLDEFDRHRIFITENKESIVIDFNIPAGVKLVEINDQQIELYLLAVNQEIRRRGIGSNILNHLIHIANLCDFEIILTPSNVYKTDYFDDRIGKIAHTKKNKIKAADLSRWYKKHGFVNYDKDDQGKQRLIFRPSSS